MSDQLLLSSSRWNGAHGALGRGTEERWSLRSWVATLRAPWKSMSTAKLVGHSGERNMVGTPHKKSCRWAASLPEGSRSGASDRLSPQGCRRDPVHYQMQCSKVTSKKFDMLPVLHKLRSRAHPGPISVARGRTEGLGLGHRLPAGIQIIHS